MPYQYNIYTVKREQLDREQRSFICFYPFLLV